MFVSGGTVDITSHEVLPNGNIKEISASSGCETGGNGVNHKFEGMMRTIFGEEFIIYYKREWPHFWLQQCQLFEQNKRKIHQAEQGSIRIPLARRFLISYEKKTSKLVTEVIGKWQELGVRIEDNDLILDFPVVFELYHDDTHSIVESIVTHLDQIKGYSRLKYIVFVGGFSDSEFLKATLCNTLGSNYVLMMPKQPTAAVLKGAVIYGSKPQTISSRIAKRTYGYSVYMPFDEDIHDDDRKVFDECDQPYCENVFEKYVTVGEEVPTDEVRVFTASPWLSTTDSLTKEIYATDEEEVMYIDEEGVEKIAEINLDSFLCSDENLLEYEGTVMDGVMDTSVNSTIIQKKQEKQCKKVIQIQVKFGGTELEIEAWDSSKMDEKVNVKLNYLLV